MSKKIVNVLLILLIALVSFVTLGCSKVDEKTQKFADLYNYTYTMKKICTIELKELPVKLREEPNPNVQLSIANKMSKTYNILAEAEKNLNILRTSPLYKKAEQAGVLEEDYINGKSLDELIKLAEKYHKNFQS